MMVLHNSISIGNIILHQADISTIRPLPDDPDSWLSGMDRKTNIPKEDFVVHCQQLSPDCFGLVDKKNGAALLLHGHDYGTMYFPAQFYKQGQPIYDHQHDIKGQYYYGTPISYYLLAHSVLTALPIYQSQIIFLIIQIIIFLLVVWCFIGKHIGLWPRLLALTTCLFFITNSPVGVFFLEQGQFYLLAASALLLTMKGWRDNRFTDFIAAGILASWRFSFLPVLFLLLLALVVFSLRPLITNIIKEKKYRLAHLGKHIMPYLHQHGLRIIGGLLVGLIPVALLFVFPSTEQTTFFSWLNEFASRRPNKMSLFHYGGSILYVAPFLILGLYLLLAQLYNSKRPRTYAIFCAVSEPLFWFGYLAIASQWSVIVFSYVFVQLLVVIPLLVDKRPLLFAPTTAASHYHYPPRLWFLWAGLFILLFDMLEYFGPWGRALTSMRATLPLFGALLILAFYIHKVNNNPDKRTDRKTSNNSTRND